MKPKRYTAGLVSLERALSKLGIASRTVANAWIVAGRVSVDGRVIKSPKFTVNPEKAKIVVDGEAAAEQKFVAFILNKPKNTVCTRNDEKGRETVFKYVKTSVPHLHTVGRLDFATTGLLILTNDTRLSDWLCNPENEVPRTYSVTVRGELNGERLEKLRQGVMDEGELLRPDKVVVQKTSGKESHALVTLHEGKNREVRRLMKAVGCEVTDLKRISYGPIELGDLDLGGYKNISLKKIMEWFPNAKTKLKG